MSYNFSNRISPEDIHNAMLRSMGVRLSDEELRQLNLITRNWNFYDGYHWEGIADEDKPQVTVNYIRAFVDKFVSFELGGGFTIKMKPEIEEIDGENDPLELLNDVWRDNNKLETLTELGQSKAITGDAWMQVSFEPKYLNGRPNPNFQDPYDEYEKGRIRLTVLPSSVCFPKYSNYHDRKVLEQLTIMYPVPRKDDPISDSRSAMTKNVMYKQVWTNKSVEIYEGDLNEPKLRIPNKYGVIPFYHFRNYPQQGRNYGLSDIEDIIPINAEINMKKSDVSEIIDYHSAPVTLVFGARVGQLERGANKLWGGLPKDAKVENLRLEGDLNAARSYIDDLKKEMHEVGSIPEGVLGGSLSISNTSGVALQISLMPLLERVKIKQALTVIGIGEINKMILLIAEKEKMITIPETVKKRKDFFYNEVSFGSILPKDSLLELQEVELEMRLGLESREGAMKRRNKSNIQEKIKEIDADREANPTLYGQEDLQEKITLIKEQAKATADRVSDGVTSSNARKVGENKEGKPKQVNAGYQNGPTPKA